MKLQLHNIIFTKGALKSLILVYLLAVISFNQADCQIPTFNKPFLFEDNRIYRFQLIIKTANVKDAGTDDVVYIRLNNRMSPFYINNSDDDRERNKTDIYEIVDPNVVFIKDIKDLTITKQGTNGWAIANIKIKINSCLVFEKSFNTQWLDGNDGRSPEMTITAQTFRNSLKWNYNAVSSAIYTPPRVIEKADIVKMVETLTGNELQYYQNNNSETPYTYRWGDYDGVNTKFGDNVEAKFRNRQTLSIDLDLKRDNPITIGYFKEWDYDFEIVISCNNGIVTVTIDRGRELVGLAKLSQYLNRKFNVNICSAHFVSNGDLIYY